MKVLQVFNGYRSLVGGEETVVRRTESLLTRHGDECSLLLKSSRGLDGHPLAKVAAFFSGIYNPAAYREMDDRLRTGGYDLVHAHNIYPLLSPSVLVACRRRGLPAVMSNHTISNLFNASTFTTVTCAKKCHGREYCAF
jgi:hypothetical protein